MSPLNLLLALGAFYRIAMPATWTQRGMISGKVYVLIVFIALLFKIGIEKDNVEKCKGRKSE